MGGEADRASSRRTSVALRTGAVSTATASFTLVDARTTRLSETCGAAKKTWQDAQDESGTRGVTGHRRHGDSGHVSSVRSQEGAGEALTAVTNGIVGHSPSERATTNDTRARRISTGLTL